MSFLALDLGGTYIKSALLDTENLTISNSFRTPIPGFIKSEPGVCEIDLSNLRLEIQKHLHLQLSVGHLVTGLVLTHQMHGFVLVDQTGLPKSNYISWQDQRANETFKKIQATLLPEFFENLGREVKPGYPIVLLSHFKSNNLNLKGLTPVSLSEWLAGELLNQRIDHIDLSNASAFGVLNLSIQNIDKKWIKSLDLEDLEWPILCEDTLKLGQVSGSLFGIKNISPINIYISQGDQQMALAGSFLKNDQTVSLNIATGSQCSLVSSEFKIGQYQTRPFLDQTFLKTQTHIPAGRAINRLVQFYADLLNCSVPSDLFERLENQAKFEIESKLKTKLGFFDGSFETNGSMLNMHDLTLTPGQFYYSCIENIVDNHFVAASRMNEQRDWKKILISGGLGQKSKTLHSLVKKKFGPVDIQFPPFPEDTLIGLLIKSYMIASGTNSWFKAQAEIEDRGIKIL